MKRRAIVLLPFLAACAADPTTGHLLGFGDPVRGAALTAPQRLGDTSRLAGDPVAAMRAVVQLEFLHEAFRTDPRYAPEAAIGVLNALRLGRAEMRQAVGIAPDAPAEPLMAQLRDAADALEAGSRARAEAALSSPMFPAGPAATIQRLGRLPFLPRVSEAAGAANAEIRRLDGRVRVT
jgi:hypothetical protein